MAKIIPGLRPWEVLSIEQAMDQITYGGQWYREPLGSYTTGPPYIRHWNKDVKVWFCVFLLVFISSFFFFLAGGWPSNWIRIYMVKIILYWKTILTAETEITV